MKYVPPYGVTDPNASYVNGDPTIGRQGSIPPAAVFENPQREIVEIISKSVLAPTDGDLTQLLQGVRSQFINYAEDTGSVDHISVAYDPPIKTYNRGLPLRVRVRETNTGGCDIDAGAGRVPVKKMNGADVQPGDLPAGCLITMVFDGTVFQLSNYFGGGGTGTNDVYMVKIPYTVDASTSPGVITAHFTPPITTLAAGDMLAVKVKNTSPGPTVMHIDSIPTAFNLAPNGGGMMLQGDIHINDVVVFFYDGTNLYFAPNPEIDAPVTYTIGTGQQFIDVPASMDAIRRKTIGANGHVTLKLAAQIFQPFTLSHPSADRITVAGTMIGPAPVKADFSKGFTGADVTYDLNMLRSKYGTEIRLNPAATNGGIVSMGLQNSGPGNPWFVDLLVTGNRIPYPSYVWCQGGVTVGPGFAISCQNVSVWGAQNGFIAGGSAMTCTSCFSVCNTGNGWVGGSGSGGGGGLGINYCGAYTNTIDGFFLGDATGAYNETVSNGRFGISCGGGTANLWWHITMSNGVLGIYACNNAYVYIVNPYAVDSCSPPFNVVGNLGALIGLANPG